MGGEEEVGPGTQWSNGLPQPWVWRGTGDGHNPRQGTNFTLSDSQQSISPAFPGAIPHTFDVALLVGGNVSVGGLVGGNVVGGNEVTM